MKMTSSCCISNSCSLVSCLDANLLRLPNLLPGTWESYSGVPSTQEKGSFSAAICLTSQLHRLLRVFLDKKLIIMINPSLSFTSHFTSASSTFRMWPPTPPPPPPILNQISPYSSSFQSLNHKLYKGSDHTPQLSSSKGALPDRAVPHMLFFLHQFPKAGWSNRLIPILSS